ncbi:MAG: hypothetical protein ACOH1J_05050 [Microbacteriaceae bacterium]
MVRNDPVRTVARTSAQFVTDTIDISLIGENMYSLLGPTRTVGFVRRQGNWFVGLLGEDVLRSSQVGESLSFDTAVKMVVDADSRRPH